MSKFYQKRQTQNLDAIDRELAKLSSSGDPYSATVRAQQAIKKARDGDGPSLIEAKTYRHSGHSRADPGKYRPDEEVKDWMENKDPITNYRKRLLEFNIDEEIISEIENKVKEQVEEATEISKASPIPDVKEIYTDVWADGGYKWHN